MTIGSLLVVRGSTARPWATAPLRSAFRSAAVNAHHAECGRVAQSSILRAPRLPGCLDPCKHGFRQAGRAAAPLDARVPRACRVVARDAMLRRTPAVAVPERAGFRLCGCKLGGRLCAACRLLRTVRTPPGHGTDRGRLRRRGGPAHAALGSGSGARRRWAPHSRAPSLTHAVRHAGFWCLRCGTPTGSDPQTRRARCPPMGGSRGHSSPRGPRSLQATCAPTCSSTSPRWMC